MTNIDKILGKSTEELEKLSDEELLSYFRPCFIFTRPEFRKVVGGNNSGTSGYKDAVGNVKIKLTEKQLVEAQVEEILKKAGIK